MSTDRKIVPMRTEKFRIAHEAMSGIASKTLAPESEVKLALLVAAYQKMYDGTTVVLKKVEEKHSRMVGRERILSADGIVRRDRVLATMIMVKLPKILITRGDLPAKGDDDDDAKNRQSVAWLIAALGPFYDHGKSEETLDLLDTALDADSLAALEAAGDDGANDKPLDVAAPAPVAEAGA